MAATTKEELLLVSNKEFAKLEKLISRVDEAAALQKDQDDTSIKDVIAHRSHWIGLFFGWYQDGLAGKEVFFPAKGYKWNELKRYNAGLRAQQLDLGWDRAREGLLQANGDLVQFILGCSEKDLYGGPMLGAKNNWTPGRWVEATGPSHYRSAAKYIRRRLKELGT